MGFFPKWTPKRYADCLRTFGSIDALWDASAQDIQHYLQWNDALISEFLTWKKTIDISQTEKIMSEEQIDIITRTDSRYPALLQQIPDAPPCLFVRGTLHSEEPSLAIVGTRAPSHYGIEVTRNLVREVTAQGIAIVSGLALGIDAIAHNETLDCDGYTIAVLGSGSNDRSIAPQTNLALAKRIIDAGGAVVSEYPPGMEATKYTFPRRNRIIAGLSLGTLVIEAGESSGALITATCSLDYNREVFAVPQSIGSKTSIGANNLLKKGAIVVTEAADIFTALNISHTQKEEKQIEQRPLPKLTEQEQTVYSSLEHGTKTIDDMVRSLPMSHPAIMTTISILELKGIIFHLGGSAYAQHKK